jgi:DNA-binding transcriptional ArsR family regulator
MSTYEFDIGDLARLRFAISPMWEVVASLRRLRDPAQAGIHLPWLNELRGGRLKDLDLSVALRLTPPRGYVPDFLSPPPSTPLARFEDEIELVRETTAKQVRNDLRIMRVDQKVDELPPILQAFEKSPLRSIKRLATELERYWQIAIDPHWPRIRALLEADIAHRARQLTEGGPAALFEDLHPTITWRDATLHVDQLYRGHVKLEGRGLLLVPSAFAWIAPATITEAPWQPTLIYPARGVATLWDSGGDRTPEALAGVIGRTRAALLAELDAPRSTTDVARLLDLTPGGASQHLTALRAAGLAAARREGRSVLYVRTPLADALVAAEPEPL